MSLQSFFLNLTFSASDKKRDAAIPLPRGVDVCSDVRYIPDRPDALLDVYYPEGTTQPLPTIVSIHGGGYVYGSKTIYQRYGMDLARRGFAFVNFNYRLAPKAKFPAPLEDTNAVMAWICANGEQYNLDPKKIFLVGDSAGAQLASHYAAIYSNPDFAKHFDFKVPDIKILAVGLNCGMYDAQKQAALPRRGIQLDYLGKAIPAEDPRLKVLDAINGNYPPTHITTAVHDFLRENAEPMCGFLREKGIDAAWKCYGREDRKQVGHVFHVNILLPEAAECNDDQCAFFRQYL